MALIGRVKKYLFLYLLGVIVIFTCVEIFVLHGKLWTNKTQIQPWLVRESQWINQSYTNIVQMEPAELSQPSPPPRSPERTKPKLDVFTHVLRQLEQYDFQLGSSTDGRKCSQEFGLELIKRWRTSSIDVCTGFRSSHINCYRRDVYESNQKRNVYSIPRLLCVATRSQIQTHPPFYTVVGSTDPARPAQIELKSGLLRVDCGLTMYEWIPRTEWIRPVSNFMSNVETVQDLHCVHHVHHTVFWMERYAEKNTYHVLEDVVTTFETLLVLQEDPSQLELVIYDGLTATATESNLFYNLWKALFGKGVRLLRTQPFPPATCFSKSIFNMPGGVSHLSHNRGVSKNTECRSPILRAMRDWMILSLLGVQAAAAAAALPGQKLKILFLSRQNYGNSAAAVIGRVIPNEEQLLSYLQTQLIAQKYSSRWELAIFRPEQYTSFKEQVQVVSNAKILIGVHGAGLALSLFLPPGAHLVEIFHSDRSQANRHYYNICFWAGINYHDAGYYHASVSEDDIWGIVKKIIDE